MFLPFHKRSLTDDSDLYNACSKCIHNDFKAAAMLQHRSTFTYITSENRFRTFCSAGRDVCAAYSRFLKSNFETRTDVRETFLT